MPPQTRGEICVHGTNVFKGYPGTQFVHRPSMASIWYLSGDTGRPHHEARWFYLAGLKDLSKSAAK